MVNLLNLTIVITMFASRLAKFGEKQAITLSEFIKRLSKPVVGQETMAEYLAMTKDQQQELKDVGGFILGETLNNQRKKGTILTASGIAFDIDDAEPGLIDKVIAKAHFFYIIYSTRKHTPSSPRFRLVIPFAEAVPIAQREPIIRKVAVMLDILNDVDPSCFRGTQMMYLPSICSDGEFQFIVSEHKTLLDTNAILANYNDWKDTLEYPLAESEKAKEKTFRKRVSSDSGSAKQLDDPRDKPGYVGAFCRAYTLTEAIDTFIPDVYVPGSVANRFSYVSASSSNGLVIFDDLWAFSHHSTDPLCGKGVNSYDIVRIHKFGELDEQASEGTPLCRLPSTLAMNEMIAQDEAVKIEMFKAQGLLDDDGHEFDFDENAFDEYPDTIDEAVVAVEDVETQLSADKAMILAMLKTNINGRVANVPENYVTIFELCKDFQGIAYNTLSCRITVKGQPSWKLSKKDELSQADISSLKNEFSKEFGLYSDAPFSDALSVISHKRAYNPIVEYISGLTWDHIPRIERFFIDYLGADDTLYVREATKLMFVAAVARSFNPGCKFDYMIVLVGPQGVGKSYILKVLGREYFSDSLQLADMSDGKKAAEKLQGYFILEVPEMAGMDKADQLALKAFLSSTHDNFRAAYARTTESQPRSCIFVGTSNESEGFLRDATGGRRYLPIKVNGGSQEKNPFTITDEIRDQLWAEAKVLFDKGFPLFLSGEAAEAAKATQKEYLVSDARAGLVEMYLELPLPQNWDDMSIADRMRYIETPMEGLDNNASAPFAPRTEVCTMEIARELFGCSKNVDKKLSRELNIIMAQMDGWERAENKLNRGPLYGRQRGFVRSKQRASND